MTTRGTRWLFSTASNGAAFLRRHLGLEPVPRTRPKGSDPFFCDGCDVPIAGLGRYVINDGYYCQRCAEEVQA